MKIAQGGPAVIACGVGLVIALMGCSSEGNTTASGKNAEATVGVGVTGSATVGANATSSNGAGGMTATTSGMSTVGNSDNSSNSAAEATNGNATSTTGSLGAPGLSLQPTATTVPVGGRQRFRCVVSGYADMECVWDIEEGSQGGSISDDGVYTAPDAPGTYNLNVSAVADDSLTASAVIRVVEPGAPGEWIDVTPEAINLDETFDGNYNYGVQDVVADPVRPSDFYAFVCYQGVWRSTDFGETWEKVSTGSNADVLETGRPWTAGIDTNPSRDPDTPPTLYTVNGYGQQHGIFKSVDGGVNWQRFELPDETGQDAYSIDVNPYNGEHLLVGFHESEGVVESRDGARTWRVIDMPRDSGVSVYAFFVDTGDPSTTASTWLAIPQREDGVASFRTDDAGESWTEIDTFQHSHGSSQIYQDRVGSIYVGGVDGSDGHGIYRSRDEGVTWELAYETLSTTILGTPNYIYSTNAQTWGPGEAGLVRGSQAGTGWTDMDNPNGMIDGAKRKAASYDGTHHVIVSGNWLAGIWRYVEP